MLTARRHVGLIHFQMEIQKAVKRTYCDKAKNKESLADVFQGESANRKVTIALLDSVNKEGRYGVFI